MRYLNKMVGFLHKKSYDFMLKSDWVGLVHLLPCYIKSVAVTVTERDV